MSTQGTGLVNPVQQFEDENGVPYASGTLTFYAAGTSNLQDVYGAADLSGSPLANPMTLNAAGRTSSNGTNTSGVYFQPLFYDLVLKNATGTIIYGPVTFNGSAWPGTLQGVVVISPAANANGYANRLTTTINKASTGTATLFAGTRFDATTIGANASTLTEAATVYIEGPPTAGTSPYALHVAAGIVKIDGTLQVTTFQVESANAVLAGPISGTAAAATFRALDPLDVGPLYADLTAQIDNATTNYATLTGLSFTLVAGKTYRFRAVLISSIGAGGVKLQTTGTATATSFAAATSCLNSGGTADLQNSTALGELISQSGVTGASRITIDGKIVVNAGGTFILQMAQASASGTTSILAGSFMGMNV